MFKLEFETDNAAFENLEEEVARLLRKAATAVEQGFHYSPMMDINGNKVGSFTLSHSEEQVG